jgi:hypothetical protein
MSEKDIRIMTCKETPSCGAAVTDIRKHRAWHERVFISEERTPRERGPRYIGDAEEDDAACVSET